MEQLSASDGGLPGVVSTRVDLPHRVLAAAEPVASPAPTFRDVDGLAGESLEERQSERLERQAAQIAAHLRRQQADLDRREAEVNARAAGIESEIRGARLWLAERVEHCDARRAELDRRDQEQKARADALEAAEARADRQTQRLAEVRAEAPSPIVEPTRNKSAKPASSDTSASQKRLAQAEDALAVERAELAKARLELTRERESFRREAKIEEQRLSEERCRLEGEFEAKQAVFKQRREDVDSRQQALKTLRDELRAAQRETLEMRLATEELWARLQGSIPPAALVQAISQTRLQLAEHFRIALGEIAQEKSDLEALRLRVNEQIEKVQRQKGELEHWSHAREQEVGQAAGRLAAREKQLERELAASKKAERKWEADRQRYEKEIRQLTRQLDGQGALA